jgi:hypothetical protein
MQRPLQHVGLVPQAEMTTKVKRWNAKQRSDRVSGAHATQQRSV